jgi:PAS domain S-box-containing protein
MSICDEHGQPQAVAGILRDISEKLQLEAALRHQATFTRLISTISTRFITIGTHEIDQEISHALHIVGTFAQADRAFVGLLPEQGSILDVPYWWCREDIEPPPNWLQGMSIEDFPWSLQQYYQFKGVAISRIADLPPEAEAERSYFIAHGIRSFLAVTMNYGSTIIGSLAFSCLREERHWSDDMIDLLKVVGEIFTNALQRKWAETALQQAHNDLEAQVAQRTAALIQANRRLELSEERYRTLVETSPSAILLTCLNGSISFCNQQAAHLFGYTSVETLCGLNGRALSDLIAFDPLQGEPRRHIKNIVAAVHMRNIEYTMRKKDGSQFPAEVSSSVVTDCQGNPTSLIVVVHDITERKRSQQALTRANNELADLNAMLSRSRDLLRAIFDGLQDGLLLLNGSGDVQSVNRAFAALLDTTPEKLIGQPWHALYPRIAPDFPGHRVLTPHPDALPGHGLRTRYRSPDGAIRILDAQAIALHHDDHSIAHIIVRIGDVTENVQLQERLLQNERFAASGRLAASVAHEINTPLQAVQTFLELVPLAPDQHERDSYLGNALEETQRMGQIVRNLLNLYRPGATVAGPVDINILLERLLLLIGKLLRDKRISIERSLAPDLPACMGRSDQLMQVLLNLMVNAIDATDSGGSIAICTRLAAADAPARQPQENQQQMLVVEIRDTGCGIAPDLQARIFDPFVTTKEKGTGLGLSISRQIMQQHGGDILLTSQPGAGSTFMLTLPCTPGHTNDGH